MRKGRGPLGLPKTVGLAVALALLCVPVTLAWTGTGSGGGVTYQGKDTPGVNAPYTLVFGSGDWDANPAGGWASINIGGSGTSLALTDNGAWSGPVALGFPFTFFGVEYSQIRAHQHGAITFGSPAAYTSGIHYPLNNGNTPNNIIAPVWDARFNAACAGSNVRYAQIPESAPGANDRVFVIQYTGILMYNGGACNQPFNSPCPCPNTYQIRLYEATDVVEVHYQRHDANDVYGGSERYAGIRGNGNGEFVAYTPAQCAGGGCGALAFNNRAVQYRPNTAVFAPQNDTYVFAYQPDGPIFYATGAVTPGVTGAYGTEPPHNQPASPLLTANDPAVGSASYRSFYTAASLSAGQLRDAAGCTPASFASGTDAIGVDGSFCFKPPAVANPCAASAGNPYTFTYRLTDGWGNSQLATANITLTNCNQFPTARNDPHGALAGNAIRYAATEDLPLSVVAALSSGPSFASCTTSRGLLCNDDDPDGPLGHNATLRAVAHTLPGLGALTDVDATNTLASGAFQFTPTANRCGETTFQYRAQDALLGNSSFATAFIRIACTHDLPVPVANAYTIDEDCQAAPNNACASPISFVATCGMPRGKELLCNDTDADDLNGGLYETTKGINDAVVELVTGTANGALVLSADGSFTYRPNNNFYGTDSFTYRLRDGATGTTSGATAAVTLTVTSRADRPVGVADEFTTVENYVLTVSDAVGLLLNDVDADPTDTLEATSHTTWTCPGATPPTGTLTSATIGGGFVFTPPNNYVGDCTFRYTARSQPDGHPAASDTLVTIHVIPPPPLYTGSDDYSLFEDCSATAATSCTTPLGIAAPGVLANDIVQDPIPIVLEVVQAPTKGTLQLNNDGSLQFTPFANQNGDDFFRYRIKQDRNGDGDYADPDEMSNTVASRIGITAVNDIPVGQAKSYALLEDCSAVADTQVCATPFSASDLLAGATDPNDTPANMPLEVLVTGTCGTYPTVPPFATTFGQILTLDATGAFTYQPNSNANGVDTFRFCIVDAAGGISAPITATFNVAAVSDRPVPYQDPGGVAGGCNSQPRYFAYIGHDLVVPYRSYLGLTANDVDPDTPNGDVVQVDAGTVSTGGLEGSLLYIGVDGSFIYRPPSTYASLPFVTQFDYRARSASDGLLSLTTATVCIVVDINPPPVAAFAVSSVDAVQGQTLTFTDLSTDTAPGIIEGWYWQFGDGRTSTDQSPTHLFAHPGVYNVRLTVTDDIGDYDTLIQQVRIHYAPEPTGSDAAGVVLRALAGPDLRVITGERVELVGSASGTTTPQFEWVQVAGPLVSLSGAQSGIASFVAPPVSASTELRFSLVVREGGRTSEADTVTVLVTPGNRAPVVAVAGPRQAAPGESVEYSAVATQDPDGDALSFTWIQMEGPPVVLTGDPSGAVRGFAVPANSEGHFIRLKVVASDGKLTGATEVVLAVGAARSAVEGFSFDVVSRDGTVEFKAKVAGASVIWDFGDGSERSRILDPVHRYVEAGTYTVTFQVVRPDGSVQAFARDVVVDEVQPLAATTPAAANQAPGVGMLALVGGLAVVARLARRRA